MENDKKTADEYPKLTENDKRWKQQDEFDSAGVQRQMQDEEANASIQEAINTRTDNREEQNNDTSSVTSGETSRRDREQP